MTVIKAAVCRQHGQPMTIETLNLRDPLAGEVSVKISAVAICHSDIHYAEGSFGGELPAVFGHEAAGEVVAVGDGVTTTKVGDKVVVTLIRSCGSCPTCTTGRPTICQTTKRGPSPLTMDDGTSVVAEMDCGAFAEQVVVDQSQVVPFTNDIRPEVAALLGCGVITGIGAVVNAGKLRAGEDVVVIGAGGVGLNAIQGARIAGARRIIAVDMTEERLEQAKSFGATDGVLATDKAPWKQVQRILRKGADLCVVTVGAIPAYDSAPRYLGWGGRLVMVGMPHAGSTASYEPLRAAYTGQGMIGSKMGDVVISRDIPWMIDLYEQGRLNLDDLVTKTWDLEQINDAIANTLEGSAIRNVLIL